MKYGSIRRVDRPVSRIVLGTSGMRSYDRAARLLDYFFARGGNCLDTGYVYGDGVCEQVVGTWLRRHEPDRRRRVVLIGKGAHPPDCRPEAIATELTVSLDRLGSERIDLYLLHRDDPQVPVGEWIGALQGEVDAGRIGAYGVSNWSRARVEHAVASAADSGADGFVAVSNHFSLAQMVEPLYPGCLAVDDDDIDWLSRRGLAVLPWSSQARGFFSDTDPTLLDPNMRRCWHSSANLARRRRAEALARTIGVQTINVALAFVLTRSGTTFPLTGPRDEAEAAIALRALDVELDDSTRRWLADGGDPPSRRSRHAVPTERSRDPRHDRGAPRG
jgi:aryl-alcohol dehydrogenase-like predicted oxidoreductase